MQRMGGGRAGSFFCFCDWNSDKYYAMSPFLQAAMIPKLLLCNRMLEAGRHSVPWKDDLDALLSDSDE